MHLGHRDNGQYDLTIQDFYSYMPKFMPGQWCTLWEGSYHDFSTIGVSFRGLQQTPLDPTEGLFPLDLRGTFAPLTIYPDTWSHPYRPTIEWLNSIVFFFSYFPCKK